MEKRNCKYCHETFEVSGRVFSNHVRWCDKNPKSKQTKKIETGVNHYYDKIIGEKKSFSVICHNCNKEFEVIEREKQFPQKDKYFCSRSCANARTHSDETKNKTSLSLLTPRENRICENCNCKFEERATSKKRFCSISCARKSCISNDDYLEYKRKCKFDFNVWDYPDDFDLSLIYKHGWYKPKNRGDNLGGVSRDHKISVRFGFDNEIDSKLIAHPANCKLMIHRDNISKNKKCSIVLEQLREDVKRWDDSH